MSAITITEREALARAGARRPRMEKRLDDVRIHVSEELKIALMELADREDRALSDYCERVLRYHVYGHGSQGRAAPGCGKGTDRDN